MAGIQGITIEQKVRTRGEKLKGEVDIVGLHFPRRVNCPVKAYLQL